ncbi:hypothetical protein RUM44_005851 [Polyplax serrata]|uniref:Uncharacterized protein n=1 Tax=Polyplax serrata TaxID=468196 RepID=A0ABR1AYB8_POLSC
MGNGLSGGTSGDRTNHSVDSYSSERNLERGHPDRSFLDRSQNLNHLDRSSHMVCSSGPYIINGHIPMSEGMGQSRMPNGHISNTQSSTQPLNVSVQRISHSHALSTLSTSKHSLGGGTSSSVSPVAGIAVIPQQPTATVKVANGGLNISRLTNTSLSRSPNGSILLPSSITRLISKNKEARVKEMLTSLGLLCLVSLLFALLSLIFLLKITPVSLGEVKDFLRTEQLTIISPEEYVIVYEITLALCSLTLSLNLCCLLVCAVQFLFAVKLVKTSENGERTNKYLQKSNTTRICAVGGFFISIPVFLTGIILYTFIQFHSTPAIITSSFIGAGIVFCGCAMVHNVFIWQMEKTNAVRALARESQLGRVGAASGANSTRTTPEEFVTVGQFGKVKDHSIHGSGIPQATMDLSVVAHELSTLV